MTSDTDRITTRRGLVRLLAVLLPLAVGAGLTLLRSGMDPSTAAMVLVLPVVAAAATGDRVAGVLAALAAAGSFDFFLTEPYYSLSIHHREDLELALALVVVGLAVTEVALWGRRQQAAALRRDGYIRGLAQLLDAPADSSVDERAAAIGAAITEALGADRTEWVTAQPRWNDAVVGPDGHVTTAGRVVPVQRIGLPTEAWTALPVRRGDRVVGHFRVSTATRVVRPSAEQLRVAELLADRMAAVLEGADPERDRA
jgi:K+-sensing histidine kinase KdpD